MKTIAYCRLNDVKDTMIYCTPLNNNEAKLLTFYPILLPWKGTFRGYVYLPSAPDGKR